MITLLLYNTLVTMLYIKELILKILILIFFGGTDGLSGKGYWLAGF